MATDATSPTWPDYLNGACDICNTVTMPVYMALLVCIIKYRSELKSSFFRSTHIGGSGCNSVLLEQV